MKPPTVEELRELRRMLVELDMVQFEQGSITIRPLEPGERRSEAGFDAKAHGIVASQGNKDITYNHGWANAPVYADIVGDYTPIPSRELRAKIRRQLDGGRKTVWFDRALAVARLRLRGSLRVSRPIADPKAGLTPEERDAESYAELESAIMMLVAQEESPFARRTRYDAPW